MRREPARPRGSPCRPPWPVRRGADADRPRTRARARLGARRQLGVRAEHDAVVGMPPFSARKPLQFVATLLANRRWVIGFATESAGWLVYVAALRLAPISLVQAICASGIAVLAFVTARPSGPAGPARQAAVVVAFAGLVLLSLSLVGTQQIDHPPEPAEIGLWLACVAGGGVILAVSGSDCARLRSGWPRGRCSRAATSAPSSSATAGRGSSPRSCSCSSTRSGRASCRAPSSTATRSPRRASRRSRRTPSRSPPVSSSSARSSHGARGTLQLAAFASLVVSGALLSGVAARRSAAA